MSCSCPFRLGICHQASLVQAPPCVACPFPGEPAAPGSMELLGSPCDLSGLRLASHGCGRAFVSIMSEYNENLCNTLERCCPACQSMCGQASTGAFLPPSSQRGCCLVLGCKHTHVIRTQIKGGIPLPASQWCLCAHGCLLES